MNDADEGLVHLKNIRSEFAEFCKKHGKITEADTRAQVIDRVLTAVLRWPSGDIVREKFIPDQEDRGYIDYALKLLRGCYIAVEAKREGIAFELPITTKKSASLTGSIMTNPDIKEAVEQVRSYCDDQGIRYSVATNGYAWIVFRAIREEGGWRRGHAVVFPSLDSIIERFTEFWNLLSYPAILAGSLDTEFGSQLRVERSLHRATDNLFNADLPLERNRLSSQLDLVITKFFDDITDHTQLDVMQTCYIHYKNLYFTSRELNFVIRDAVPEFLKNEKTDDIQQGKHDSGKFGIILSGAVDSDRGQLCLLLGGIGAGKTTFLKRYQMTVGKAILDTKTLWFHVDFRKPPLDPNEMEEFVWRKILEQLRTRYDSPKIEVRKLIKKAYAVEIEALAETALRGLHPSSPDYEDALTPFLRDWQADVKEFVPRMLALCKPEKDYKVVLFIDNVDQLDPEKYQSKIFLLGQTVTKRINSVTIIALREESYYTAKIQKTFTAYSNIRKFHIASPNFKFMALSRVNFALVVLSSRPLLDKYSLSFSDSECSSISDFLKIVKTSVFEGNWNICRCIEAICFGNMRLALELFSKFLCSGATDVDKMLKIYRRDGNYSVAYHEFIKSITLDDRSYFKEQPSKIMNVFDCGIEKNSSHFTCLRILALLISVRGLSADEGQGYYEISKIVSGFEDVFDNREDVIVSLNRLLTKQLIEVNTRSTETIRNASHARVTSAGWFYSRNLVKEFSYLDLMLQNTPLNDEHLARILTASIQKVNNLIDREDQKIERTDERFARTEKFMEYLAAEEAAETKKYGLDKSKSVISESIVPAIRANFNDQKSWISRRLRENRERYAEELTFNFDDAELQFIEQEIHTHGDEAVLSSDTPSPNGTVSLEFDKDKVDERKKDA